MTMEFNQYDQEWARRETLTAIENLYAKELTTVLKIIGEVAAKGLDEVIFRPNEIRDEIVTWLLYKNYTITPKMLNAEEIILKISW